MNIKFRVTYEDGTFMDSHDEMWNPVRDHCHALPPHNEKKWRAYEIWSDDFGLMMGVNFENGIFNIKGQIIHPADNGGTSLTFIEGKQKFPCSESTKILNGLNYFPVFGRKMFKGDWGEAKIYFCGWKKKVAGKTYERTMFLYPNGQISIK